MGVHEQIRAGLETAFAPGGLGVDVQVYPVEDGTGFPVRGWLTQEEREPLGFDAAAVLSETVILTIQTSPDWSVVPQATRFDIPSFTDPDKTVRYRCARIIAKHPGHYRLELRK